MKQYFKSYELKNRAKDNLQGKYRSAVLICFLNLLIPGAINMAVSSILMPFMPAISLEGGSVSGLFPYYVFNFVLQVILSSVLGVFNAGISLFFLNVACNQPCSTNDLFYGFTHDFGKFLTLSTVFTVLNAICLSPGQDLLDIARMTGNPSYFFEAAAAMAVGFCIYIPINLGLAISFYLMLDFPDKSAGEILSLSFRLMKGNKKRLFCLELSFIPMMILCVFTFYVGFLWLTPYMQMTYVRFFLDLMNPRETA